MAKMAKLAASYDARRLNQENNVTVTVIPLSIKIRGMWKVRLGLLFVRLGVWIAGIGYREE